MQFGCEAPSRAPNEPGRAIDKASAEVRGHCADPGPDQKAYLASK